jgi:hypothetical protein
VVKKRAARSCANAAPCEGDGPVQNDLLFDFWLDTSYDKDRLWAAPEVDLTLGGPAWTYRVFQA